MSLAAAMLSLTANINLTAQTLDNDFAPTFDGPVRTVAVQSDGRVVVGGAFASVNGTPRGKLVRLNADGSVDASFATDAPAQFVSQIVTAGSKTYVAAGDGIRQYSASGTLDWSYPLAVSAVAPDGQGRVLIGGPFTRLENQPHQGIARLSSGGTLDNTFNAQMGCCPGDGVFALAIQGDAVLAGGQFQSVNGQPANHLVRLTSAGAVDSAFSATAEPLVIALHALPDGKVYRLTTKTLTRHHADGTLDSSFPAVSAGWADERFTSLAVQPDGRVLVGGAFTIGNATRFIARYSADGQLDNSFSLNFSLNLNGAVQSVAVSASGDVVFAGDFTEVNGVTRSGLARVRSTPAAPALKVTPVGLRIVLTWPAQDGDWQLQRRGLLNSTWVNVPVTPVLSEGNYEVTDSAAGVGSIYRLVRP
jgi:uncharacterized delta-60 repeat protein